MLGILLVHMNLCICYLCVTVPKSVSSYCYVILGGLTSGMGPTISVVGPKEPNNVLYAGGSELEFPK